jgi:TfoX/Sxy family transcriptional regulator of competence genes
MMVGFAWNGRVTDEREGADMGWGKASPEISELLAEALTGLDCVNRPMFGGPAYFTNGNMFAGVMESRLLVRLPEADRAEAAALGAVPFEPMGRPMREYVVLPEDVLRDPAALRGWLVRSAAYASSLPPKEKKPRTKRG